MINKKVNGVMVLEIDKSPEIQLDIITARKTFELEYKEKEFYQGMVFIELRAMQTADSQYWMYVIQNEEFLSYPEIFTSICYKVHNKIAPFLEETYGIDPDVIALEHASAVY